MPANYYVTAGDFAWNVIHAGSGDFVQECESEAEAWTLAKDLSERFPEGDWPEAD